MNKLIRVLLCIIAPFVVYSALAFIRVESNPLLWEESGRVLAVFGTMGVWVLILVWSSIEHD